MADIVDRAWKKFCEARGLPKGSTSDEVERMEMASSKDPKGLLQDWLSFLDWYRRRKP